MKNLKCQGNRAVFIQQYFPLIICRTNFISNYWTLKSLQVLCITENRNVIKLVPIGKYES